MQDLVMSFSGLEEKVLSQYTIAKVIKYAFNLLGKKMLALTDTCNLTTAMFSRPFSCEASTILIPIWWWKILAFHLDLYGFVFPSINCCQIRIISWKVPWLWGII